MKKIIFQCGSVWLGISLLLWWLFFYSPLEIPPYIGIFSDSRVSVYGLILIVVLIFILRFFLKRYLRQEPEAPLSDLVSVGLLSILLAEIVFQLIRQLSYTDYTPLEHLQDLMFGVFGMPLYAGAISLWIGAKLKKNKNRLIPIISISLILLFGYVYKYLKSTGVL
jgi:hypothetical protein